MPFDIMPLTGDLFAQQTLKSGHYQFNVVAMDSTGRSSQAIVRIVLGDQPFRHTTKSPSRNRQLRSLSRRTKSHFKMDKELVFSIFEDHVLGLLDEVRSIKLKMLIFLFQNIKLIEDEFIAQPFKPTKSLSIHKNGSIELVKPLNFEMEPEIRLKIPIESGAMGKSKWGFCPLLFVSNGML